MVASSAEPVRVLLDVVTAPSQRSVRASGKNPAASATCCTGVGLPPVAVARTYPAAGKRRCVDPAAVDGA